MSSINKGEKYVFNLIKNDVNIMFDVGSRDDTYYLSEKNDIEIHLFEPNIKFYNELLFNINKYQKINKNIFVNNFGLGSETLELKYYHNTESFTKLVFPFSSDVNNTSIFKVVSFSDYIQINNITKIDFIKIDTEGYELDVIYSDVDFIKNKVKYLQFEYSSAWLNKDTIKLLDSVMMDFENEFDFYIVLDESHPISKKYVENLTMINHNMLNEINLYMRNGYGYNILMIKK